MNKIKKSGSGLQLTKNKFCKLNDCFSFNKNYGKISHIEFEIEKQKEIMLKLKIDINKKEKEINELTLINKTQNNIHLKKIKLIEEILRLYQDKKESKLNSPKLKIETEIEKNIIDDKIKEIKEIKDKEIDLISNNNNINLINEENDNELDNKTNARTFYTTNNNFTNKMHVLPKIKSPKLKSKLFINTNIFMKKKKLKDMLYMTTLRNQINTLKEKLEKKKEEILDYKSKCEGNDYTNLENDLLSNYDKIKELKYKNAEMIANLEDFLENYFLQREENFQLKNKLKDFIDTFNTYKENTEKNNLDLEKKLKYLEEKNIECIIYHNNKIKNLSKCVEDNKSKLTEAGNLIEKINEEIEEINKDIKSKNNNINQHQNEIEILNNKKKELEKNKKKNEENINKMNIQRDESNKINKERVKNKINLKNRYKEIKLKYKNTINKVDEINELINKKDKEINDLKKEIEEIKISRNLFQ